MEFYLLHHEPREYLSYVMIMFNITAFEALGKYERLDIAQAMRPTKEVFSGLQDGSKHRSFTLFFHLLSSTE